MEVKFIIGKQRDRTPQRPQPQGICRALWLTPWPSLILKSLSWIILSKLSQHLRVSTWLSSLSFCSFTLTCQGRLSGNTGVTSDHPTDVPFKRVGAEPTIRGSHKHGNMQPKDFQWIGTALGAENSVSWVEPELHISIRKLTLTPTETDAAWQGDVGGHFEVQTLHHFNEVVFNFLALRSNNFNNQDQRI